MPAPFNHSSGLSGVFDRTPDNPDWTGVLFREGKMGQAAELMELQSILGKRNQRVGNLTARDGDRVDGADVIVDVDAGTVTLTAGRIYVNGDVRSIAAAVLTSVPMTGEVKIGVRMISTVITELENPDLLGLMPGTEAEGEPGAGREVQSVSWGRTSDGDPGELYAVYLLRDGVIIDQTAPPQLNGINQAIAVYDRDAHGNYVVNGCRVSVIAKISGSWHFGISEGVANIRGFKRTRQTAMRHVEPETFDTRLVSSEPHTFGTGTSVIALNHTPLNAVVTAIVTKEKTVTVTKGTTNSQDALPDAAVSAIISVVQGGTTYVAGTSYLLTADKVDWTPGGAEPSSGSTYSVTYRYLAAVTPVATDDTSVSLTGGVTGTAVFISYTHKLPRVDLLCLNDEGSSVYLKGISSVDTPRAPGAPTNLLALATISNTWDDLPTITNADIRSVPFEELWHYLRRVADMIDLLALERLKRDIDSREPVAKKGVFVDPWTNDFYRDAGEVQTAALFDGFMRLAIDPSFFRPTITAPICLDYTEDVLIRQELATACSKINPYLNFNHLPGTMAITPAADFWVEKRTDWLSPITQEFVGVTNSTTTAIILDGEHNENVEMLRQISVAFVIHGFGVGEHLSRLEFDSLNVMPAGLIADSGGVVSGSFTIPANVPAGVKSVRAAGAGGSLASAQFVGQGTIEVDVMRRVTTIFNAPPPPPAPELTSSPWPPGFNSAPTGDDPLAQTFTLTEPRHIVGIDLKWCAKGDPTKHCLVRICTVENGLPTTNTIAEAFVDMNTVVLAAWTNVRFLFPVFLQNDREYAFVILTDDPVHAISTAQVGDFDSVKQEFVAAQPYSVGVMLSSSNAKTWTAHQNEDITFRIVAALFSPTTKSINLGSHSLTNASDIVVRGAIELPTSDAGFYFEIQRADASVTRLLPGQNWQLTEYVTETVQLRGVMTGSAKISPILYPNVLMVAGSIRTTGTYISRAFDMGTAIRLSNFFKAFLPSGSSVTVEIDKVDDTWTSVSLFASTVLDGGEVEREYRVTPYTTPLGRLRLTLTGSPAARPRLSDFRAVAI